MNLRIHLPVSSVGSSLALFLAACVGTTTIETGAGGADSGAARGDSAAADTGSADAGVADSGFPADTTAADVAEDSSGPEDLGAMSDVGGDTAAEEPDVGDEEPDPDPQASEPVLYPADQFQSPITRHVADNLRRIANLSDDPQDDVFMKVGASGTVSTHLLYCYATGPINLDGREALQPTIDYFLGGDANDRGEDGDLTPFNRPTYAAVSGRTARWAISGSPSPIEREINAISPRFALINYGTNDMQQGTTYASAMPGFYESYVTLVDQVIERGIVPILVGLNPRSDIASASMWVPTYNTVVRGVAQGRQVPFQNLNLAMQPLPDLGLSSDGLHANVYRDGGARPCIFTAAGLQYGYNVRNLITLESLERVVQVVIDGVDALDASGALLRGDGSPQDPFEIPALPFTHMADTSESPHTRLDFYDCEPDTDETGPEYLYALTLTRETRIRAMVQDGAAVDIDLHLLDTSASEAGCIGRAHRLIEGTLPAGDYVFALDTWVNGAGQQQSGEYLFVVLECEPGDGGCNESLL